jgi:hypothetical protein
VSQVCALQAHDPQRHIGHQPAHRLQQCDTHQSPLFTRALNDGIIQTQWHGTRFRIVQGDGPSHASTRYVNNAGGAMSLPQQHRNGLRTSQTVCANQPPCAVLLLSLGRPSLHTPVRPVWPSANPARFSPNGRSPSARTLWTSFRATR